MAFSIAGNRLQMVERISTMQKVRGEDQLPCTHVCMHPKSSKQTLMLACSAAQEEVQHWELEVDGAQVFSYSQTHVFKEVNNEVLCVDYNKQGTNFATGGSDRLVRIYDGETKQRTHECKPQWNQDQGTWVGGHNSRIYCTRFAPSGNLLLSAGWESPTQVFDLRTGSFERSLKGAHVSGDGLDFKQDTVAVANYRGYNQLQVFNYLSGTELDLTQVNERLGGCHAHAARFSSSGKYLFVVTSQPASLRVLDTATWEEVAALKGINTMLSTAATHPLDDSLCVVAGSKGCLMLTKFSQK
eukprot:CAMPEP_0174375446 /NCGR_PEP_ID=MMETSP0811_2-20130205/114609_1 /TAXON_ID=73025 ORGANISM="Eutreptiella gymnastica-like, Strain CCMP1594" /NCGR_SAMPLE_ID=MMETSP0811_2 /ASSEMBLY_ACC=CAM_ASM_000667 /LENGTH=298 /DNA_ID=CAMNT_0015525681 /DNA_START=65 /DNA_END=961 /DNA_ORIENTATION=-